MLLLTPGELTADPRGRRQAKLAQAAGWSVSGVCARLPGQTAAALDGIEVTRVARFDYDPILRTIRGRLGERFLAKALVREARGAFRVLRLVQQTLRLWRAGRRLGVFDVVHANDVDTLPAAWLLGRRSRLVYDAHELYTAQEPDPPRVHRAVVARLERVLARRATAVVTVSEELAAELARSLHLRAAPIVVLNCPERRRSSRAVVPPGSLLRVVYQAGAGTGRRLQDILDAAGRAEDVEFTLRVLRADDRRLRDEIVSRGLSDRVVIEPPVDADRLVEALEGYDVGIVIDRPVARNNELGLPNKFFEYLMAGLAVVAPRLPALQRVVEGETVGLTFVPGSPADLAGVLTRLAHDRKLLHTLRHNASAAALNRYNAEVQGRELLRAWGVDGAGRHRDD